MTADPLWLTIARKDLGLREVPGVRTAPRISQMLRQMRAWWDDDETPWCGAAVDAWLRESGIAPARNAFRARAWLEWGVPLPGPVVGCVVVLGRQGGGHVALMEGVDRRGRWMLLGGNQGNQVSLAPFDPARVLGCRWPAGVPIPTGKLPLIVSAAASSSNEA